MSFEAQGEEDVSMISTLCRGRDKRRPQPTSQATLAVRSTGLQLGPLRPGVSRLGAPEPRRGRRLGR